MNEITVTIDEKWFNTLTELLAIFDATIDIENKELKKKILHTHAAFHSAREKVDIEAERCYCCHKENVEFYTDKEGKRSKICKACETARLNPFHPERSFLFEKYDIPLIYDQWFGIIESFLDKHYIIELQSKPSAVFEKYLARMKLRGYRIYGYQDSNMFNMLKESMQGKEEK
jgi:hypothetical protein